MIILLEDLFGESITNFCMLGQVVTISYFVLVDNWRRSIDNNISGGSFSQRGIQSYGIYDRFWK